MLDIQSISNGLKLADDGIWYSSDVEEVSYPPGANDALVSIEEKSFWFKHRNECITSVVRAFPPKDHGVIFDIGGGNGFVSLSLVDAGFDVVLVEPGQAGSRHAKNRGLKQVICATANAAEFAPHSLPAVGLFDVVEHIEDDVAFLESLKGMICKEGRLYLTVPSYTALWSNEDISAGHFRRYNLKEMGDTLAAAGFEVEFATYIFRYIPVPTLLLRTLPYRMGISKYTQNRNQAARDHVVSGGILSSVLDRLLRPEIKRLQNKQAIRFGSSCLVVAKSI